MDSTKLRLVIKTLMALAAGCWLLPADAQAQGRAAPGGQAPKGCMKGGGGGSQQAQRGGQLAALLAARQAGPANVAQMRQQQQQLQALRGMLQQQQQNAALLAARQQQQNAQLATLQGQQLLNNGLNVQAPAKNDKKPAANKAPAKENKKEEKKPEVVRNAEKPAAANPDTP